MRLIAATGVAVMALAGAASAESGYVGLSRTSTDLKAATIDSTALSGAVSMPLRGRLDFQLDATVGDAEDSNHAPAGGTFHVVGRNQGWMLGAFAGGLSGDPGTIYAVGAEGALYYGRFTLAGALAYADSDSKLDTNGIIFEGEGRYFVTRHLRLDGVIGYSDYDTGPASWRATTYGAGAELQFAQTPISVFGALSRVEASNNAFDADVLRVGLRYNFDSDLAKRDEAGASLMTAPSLLGAL
jgi:hypothetical protein